MRKIVIGLWIVSVFSIIPVNMIPQVAKETNFFVVLWFLSLFGFVFYVAIISSVSYIYRTITIRNEQNQRRLALIEDVLRQLLEKNQEK